MKKDNRRFFAIINTETDFFSYIGRNISYAAVSDYLPDISAQESGNQKM